MRAILRTFQNTVIQFFTTMQKIDPFETWFERSKMKILLCKGGKRKILYLIKNFDCLVKFWTLLYSSKTQWSNSQKANFIGFKQGQF